MQFQFSEVFKTKMWAETSLRFYVSIDIYSPLCDERFSSSSLRCAFSEICSNYYRQYESSTFIVTRPKIVYNYFMFEQLHNFPKILG